MPGALRWKTPAELIAWVTSVGLADVSLYTTAELKEMGWYDNPTVDRLYELTNAGVWIARTNASGQVAEANSASVLSIAQQLKYQGYDAIPKVTTPVLSPDVNYANFARRTAQIALNTDGAGACAATVLHTGPAGYYPVVRCKQIVSSVADGSTELNFTVSGGALLGPAQRIIALVTSVMLELGDMLLYDVTDATTISAAIANGPLNSTVWLEIEYWSET